MKKLLLRAGLYTIGKMRENQVHTKGSVHVINALSVMKAGMLSTTVITMGNKNLITTTDQNHLSSLTELNLHFYFQRQTF